MPFGTRGGMRIDYTFPQDAEYEISAALARDLNEGMPVYTEPQVLEVSIDRERVATFTLDAANALPLRPEDADDFGGRMNRRVAREEQQARNRADENWSVRVPVSAGRREVDGHVPRQGRLGPDRQARAFLRPFPRGLNIPEGRYGSYLRHVEISGPYDGDGAWADGEPRAHLRLPARPPSSAAADAGSRGLRQNHPRERSCARAYRRPVGDADVAPFVEFYRAGHADAGSFDGGIQVALKALLVSPEFLFRVAQDPPGAAPGSLYRIGDVELASRLSFFLWSSIPDDELLRAAERGALHKPAELERQVRRMIADPRADAFVGNFAGQWLYLRNLDAVIPVQSIFPNFDDTLREGLRRETELFFASVLREDRSVLELLECRLHVRQRARRAALRLAEREGQSLPARAAAGRQPAPRAARPRQLAGRDLVRRSHFARRARPLDPREPARRRAAAAAGERAAARGDGRDRRRRARCCRCASGSRRIARTRAARRVIR